MVCGIVGLAISIFGLGIVGVPTSIVGLILGIVAKKKSQSVGAPSSQATAGIVLSIIAIALGILFIVVCSACLGSIASIGSNS